MDSSREFNSQARSSVTASEGTTLDQSYFYAWLISLVSEFAEFSGTQATRQSIDIDIHLLTDIDEAQHPECDRSPVERECLRAPCWRRQRFLGDHIRLEADKFQGISYRTVSTRRRHRLRSAPHTPGIVLIYITRTCKGVTPPRIMRGSLSGRIAHIGPTALCLQNDAAIGARMVRRSILVSTI